MAYFFNTSDINQTFIIEPLSITGGSPTLTACTALYTNAVVSCDGDTQILMGTGVITFNGNLYTNDDLTGNVINASTYYSGGTNLFDIIESKNITGGTFNNNTDTLNLYKTNGSVINVTGFTDYYTTGTTIIGSTAYFDRNDKLSAYTLNLAAFTANTFVTGVTFTNNQLIIVKNDGTSVGTFINTFTGLTITGLLKSSSISANTISATTYYGDGSYLTGIVSQDTYVTGGTYSAGTAIFTNNTGGTFSVTGFSTSNATAFTGGTVTGSTFFSGGLSATTISATTYLGLPITTDIFVTGGTYNEGVALFTNNSGDTFNVTGFTTPFTGGTVTGPTVFMDGLTANTISVIDPNTNFSIVGNIFGQTNLISPNGALVFTPGYGGVQINGAFPDLKVNGSIITDGNLGVGTLSTNTTATGVLVRNESTNLIEKRSINSLINVVNLITVGLSGSTGVDYNSIKEAVDGITGASATNTYVVKVGPGVFYENPITMKSYVDVIGESETNTIIQANNPNTSLIIGADQSMVSDVQIQGCTGTGVSAVMYSSPTTPQLNAIFYVENVRFGANYTHAKTVGTGSGNCIMQCSNVKYGGYPFTVGFYVTNDGSGVGRMQLRNVTSTNGGVTTTAGLVFAKADQPSCAFIVNGCLLTKASGAAAGTGFWVENGGSLRLTAVNFQRWATGIYAPQIGSAPSIEAIALNFENCTTDVNIIHSGATGKVQGTDNYVKTLINIDAPLYEVNNDPRVITVAKKGGDFSSIKSAVDSITGSSINNRFLVSVGPGRFSENEIDLTGKPYVSVEGSNIITTEIVPNSNTQHIFKIGQNNELSFFSLSGAPSGYAAIYVYDIGDYAQAHKLSFTDCDTNVWVESDTQDTIFFGEYLDFNGSYSYGTKIIANNGYVASANMENYYNFPTGTGTTIANSVQGSGGTLSVFVGDGVGNGVTGSTNYQVFDYGSLNTTTTTADGWDYCVRNPNIGGPSRFDIDSISVINSMTYDISVEHPNTFGTFNGSASHVKVNTLSNNVYWSFLDIDDGEFDVTRKISVTFQDGTHTDASTLIFEGSTMGLINGGVITLVSGLTVNISAGFGYLEKTVGNEIYMRIDWDDTQITLSPNSENYLFFNENNILSVSSNAPDNTTNIILGRVVTDSTGLRFIDVTPYNASHTSNLLSTFNRNALGPIYAGGSFVTENTTPYHLNISSGDYYYSENNFTPTGGTDVLFIQYYRDGGTGWVTTGTTEVVNGYDNNSGTISPLPLSSFTKHTLYVVGEDINEKYMLVLGQIYYNSLVEAEGADLPTPPNYFDDGVTTIASIYIQQGMSGITEIQDIRPVIGFKAAGISATAVHGNLLGLNADDHKQYLLIDGSRAMTNNLSMGGNAIVSALTVNDVVVESHASRHKNGGADEISTATPAPSEIPKSDTFGKLDGWISDASTTVKGLTRLSQAPASAMVPIAVGVNDPRFLNSITGVTNTTPSLVFVNNTGGTTTISNIRLNGVTATTISATTYQNLPVDVRVTGGTYSYTDGTATYMNNTGGTFSVTGFSKNLWYAENSTPPTIAPTAIGTGSIVFGDNASSSGSYSFVYGNNSISPGNDTNVLGRDAGSYAQNANFFGQNAGSAAGFSHNSNFMGAYAGYGAYSSNNSNFFGYYVGFQSQYSVNDNFIGNYAGFQSSNVTNSNFIGEYAGFQSPNVSFSNFIGHHAGLQTSSISNSNFIGESAGKTAINANYANFMGSYAGNQATNASYSNFIGDNAGQGSNTGYNSNFLGQNAGKGSNDSNNSNFFGYGAGENSYASNDSNFLGQGAGQNAFGSNYSNFFGNNAGQGAYVSNWSNFFGERAGKTSQYSNNSNFLGQGAGQNAINAYNSNFLGQNAGLNTTNAYQSNFFGQNAGESTSAYNSNFIGFYAGNYATNAYQSTFIGAGAGQNATNANDSNFIGYQAGQNAPSASNSVFIGNSAGYEAINAYGSNFLGNYAGYQANTANNSNFFGNSAGQGAISTYNSNFFGQSAGTSSYNSYESNFLGKYAGQGTSNGNNTNFLGSYAGQNSQYTSDSNFIGKFAGQGTTYASNSNFMGQYAGVNTYASNSNFLGQQAGYQATYGNNSNFLGFYAGYNATSANNSNFLGQYAGNGATSASYSNFMGQSSGGLATDANNSNFFGPQAGQYATYAANSNFFGQNAGQYASYVTNSNFMGYNAGQYATYAGRSNFFGEGAGQGATYAPHSNFFGYNAGRNVYGGLASNNIIIGTNISLPPNTLNSINIGGVLFGTGTYSNTDVQSISAQTNGRIGINVVTPTEALHVSGNTKLQGKLTVETSLSAPASAENRAVIYANNTETGGFGNSIGLYAKVSTSSGIAVYGNSTDSNGFGGYFVGKGYFSGNLGIGSVYSNGITTPSLGFAPNLAIAMNTGSTGAVLDLRNTSNAVGAGDTTGTIQFTATNGVGNGWTTSQIKSINYGSPTGGSGGGILSFLTSAGSLGDLPTERMRINSLGNVLIGTTSGVGDGTAKLQVSGTVLATSVSATTYLNLPNSTFNGGTVTGATRFTGGLSATTISATTYDNLPSGTTVGSFGITIDGAGSVITTGVKGYTVLPYNAIITGWDIVGDTSGSCVIDVWKASIGTIPTAAGTIAGTEKPTLAIQQINSDNNLTSWTTGVSLGDVIAFNVNSATSLTRVNLIIKVIKT